ncbi:nicotinate-nucleotide adenylyltransferase [Corynebacterium sp. TAE3-ERU12]|uniref:nicotinate-nucleotide adenylyltransferase n=1 Tax=Corynebacterium sp. TAE3-ERU12 TaxID=2849491 RepID=UPI001C453512|nr:nicotinate-nucleotide adenylyltransferase [Corynebacterium sp. TAE3-ERU12]MBV7294987.1 nicotinate-nucleotide adenylyltransferase [Corynebacterium sp. TAE3-ERU12]
MSDSRHRCPPRRIGVMGGTFDPIHHGHLVAASEVADRFELDLVVFVPTGEPWQKRGRAVTDSEDRYLMTVIATASNPRFMVSRVDIDRGGPTYTVDTLRDLHVQFGENVELFFITGADALQRIVTWRDWEKMFDQATFVGVNRPGFQLADDDLPAEYRSRIHLLEIPAMAISSTECRERASKGRPVWYLVPDGVVQYIAKRGLYQGIPPLDSLTTHECQAITAAQVRPSPKGKSSAGTPNSDLTNS